MWMLFSSPSATSWSSVLNPIPRTRTNASVPYCGGLEHLGDSHTQVRATVGMLVTNPGRRRIWVDPNRRLMRDASLFFDVLRLLPQSSELEARLRSR